MTSRGNREPSGKNQSPATLGKIRSFAETLRRQFRECVRSLTGRGPEPQPRARRRRTEDTGKSFRPISVKIASRMARGIFHVSRFTWRAPEAIDPANLAMLHTRNAYRGSQAQNNDAATHQNLSPHL